VELDVESNRVVVGSDQDVFAQGLEAGMVNWVAIPELQGELEVEAKIRYNVRPAPAVIRPGAPGRVITVFEQPQRAVTPGQAVVWYQGDVVIGGGVIQRRVPISP